MRLVRSFALALVALVVGASPTWAARTFASASSQRIDLDANVGNWTYTQAFSIACDVKPTSNASGAIFSKWDATSQQGWQFLTISGTSNPTFEFALGTSSTTGATAKTTTEWTTGSWYHVVVVSSGSGTVAGITIYVNGTSQSLTSVRDNISGGSMTNSDVAQFGARGGTASPGLYLNASLRRCAMWNSALSSSDVTALYNSGNPNTITPNSKSPVLWHEFGPLNDGATLVADWSGNGHTGFVTGATYSSSDPTITNLTPTVGSSGGTVYEGPLTKSANPPLMENQGYASNGTLPSGTAGDQIGPGYVWKQAAGDYRGYIENDTGIKSIDTADQTGSFDWDVPTIYATSSDGTTWNFNSQGNASGAVFNAVNIGGSSAFKAAVRGETSISAIFYDPDDAVWKAWFHGGNNSGTRQIYYATCATSCTTAGQWTVQNSGNPVLTVGTTGAWDAGAVADAKVIRVNGSLMKMIYKGNAAGGTTFQIGEAESTNRGLTWTKYASNPVITAGAAGTWDSGDVHTGGFVFDPYQSVYLIWYGASQSGSTVTKAIGFAYSTDAKTWTKGPFNPVVTSGYSASGTNNLDYIQGTSIGAYLDGNKYRIWYRADNGVSGTTGFRGRNEATLTFTPPSGGGSGCGSLLLMGIGCN